MIGRVLPEISQAARWLCLSTMPSSGWVAFVAVLCSVPPMMPSLLTLSWRNILGLGPDGSNPARAVRILSIRPHVDEQLRGGAAEPPDVGRAEQDLGNAQPVDRVRAAPLGRDQDPRVARNDPLVDEGRQRELRVEEHAARVAAERLHDVRLELPQLLRGGRQARPLAQRDEALPLVVRHDRQPAVVRRELLEGTGLGRCAHSCSFIPDMEHFRA